MAPRSILPLDAMMDSVVENSRQMYRYEASVRADPEIGVDVEPL